MRLLSRFGLAALVSFLLSSVISAASYYLGLWLGRNRDNLLSIIYGSFPFALVLGVAAIALPRRRGLQQGRPILAVLVGAALGILYTLIIARFWLVIPAFVVLMLSCWVPSGMSAMAAVVSSKRLSAVIGIAILCLAAILLTAPIFNAFTHNQQMTVALITPFEMSTAGLGANPETFGFVNGDEIQTARNEVLERLQAFGYTETFRVLSITRWGKGSKSLAILVVRTPITKEAVLRVPDKSTVVYTQRADNWEKKPAEVSLLHRGITMEPPTSTDESLGYFEIPDAQGVSLMGRIIAKAPVQPR
jgi:hypothetical protein